MPKLRESVNEVAVALFAASPDSMGGARRCLWATVTAYDMLSAMGHKVSIHYGYGGFSVNPGEHGFVSFGEPPSVSATQTVYNDHSPDHVLIHGHFWLVADGRVVDFTMCWMDIVVAELDRVSGIPTGPILTPRDPLVSPTKIKPFAKLEKGAMGFHYHTRKVFDREEINELFGFED